MKKIFIDTENISDYTVLKHLELSEKDEIILFLSENTKRFDYMSMHTINSFGAKIKTILLNTFGKNSMDIQISTYIGLSINKDDLCFIISDDKDFKSTKSILDGEGYNISLINTSFSKNKLIVNSILNTKKNIEDLEIIKIIKESACKRDFHNNLVKIYGENGKKLYTLYKNEYTNYCKKA